MKLNFSFFVLAALARGVYADVVITSTYSADGKNSASTVYAGASRQRVDVGDNRVIQQCDLKRIVQLDDYKPLTFGSLGRRRIEWLFGPSRVAQRSAGTTGSSRQGGASSIDSCLSPSAPLSGK
jgi:hypothetical protein